MAAIQPLEKSMAVPEYPVWRLTVEQYHEMIHAGILKDGDPVELLEGWLIIKMTKNRPHSISTQNTRDAIARILPSDWYADDQEPISTEDSEPEPDISVVKGKREDYANQPPADAVALVIEVSDATLQQDRMLKLRLYARAGIPVYWIINLPDRQLEVYSDPGEVEDRATYRQSVIYQVDDTIPVVIRGQEIARLKVSDLLARTTG
jgi:Uma2 family endonuclease